MTDEYNELVSGYSFALIVLKNKLFLTNEKNKTKTKTMGREASLVGKAPPVMLASHMDNGLCYRSCTLDPAL